MKTEDKLNIQANRLLGEFIGTLEGVCLWEIPEELKLKLQTQLTALRKVKIISSNLPVIKSVCCDNPNIQDNKRDDGKYCKNCNKDV